MTDKRLRIEQRKDEPPDLFVLRAFVKALPHMDANALNALSQYIAEIARLHAGPDRG